MWSDFGGLEYYLDGLRVELKFLPSIRMNESKDDWL